VYVSKEGTLIELGVKPMENGKKCTLLEFKERIETGEAVLDIAEDPALFVYVFAVPLRLQRVCRAPEI